MGLMVLFYLSIFLYIFCFTLFYFIYCKISNLYFILFLFLFYYFCLQGNLSCLLTSHKGMYTQRRQAKIFLEGRDQLGFIHMEGKDSPKEKREVF